MGAASRRGRRIVAATIAVVAVPLVLVALAQVLLPSARLTARLASEVTRRTGAEFNPGEVAVTVVGGPGLALTGGRLHGDGVELTRRTGAATGLGDYDLAYDRLEIRLGLRALVRREIEVTGLRLSGPRLQADWQGDRILAEDFALRVTDLRYAAAAGPAPARGAPPGAVIPADLACDFELRVARLSQRGTVWEDVSAGGPWRERRCGDGRLAAKLGGGTVTGTATLDYAADPGGRLDAQLDLRAVPAGPLLQPYLPDLGRRLDCALDGSVVFGLALRDAATRSATLSGSGTLTAPSGALDARDWLREIAPYLGSRQDLMVIRFDRLEHRLAMQQGRYVIERLELDGPDTAWQAAGWLDFGGDLDLSVGVRLPAGFTPNLGSLSFLAETLRDGQGRVGLGLKLTGQTSAPTIGLDWERMR